ncbi:sugar ABC transporter substrate-binding protein [Vagococcus fluvialis]|uniref:Sugar ABC transporter substrate-binding protein n=2 Tax=Vagococcus fluvialis TaxID=2738 RepID=A0A7X6D707_9ENTE|nr:sugar ABC transporter substrate-binding protein [Vagococcus fluvialis]
MTVGYAINNLNDTFQTYILEAAKDKAKENDMNIRVENAKEDLIAQQDQVNTLIQNGVDALIVVPVDTSAMDPITKAAQNADIPLIYVNRNPYAGKEDKMPKNVYYVGSEEITAGIMQMEFIGEKLGGKGNIAILMGILGNEGAMKRTEGVEQVIKEKYPEMKVLNKETAEWQRDKAIAVTENWISTYGKDINAVIANNDEMALGALQAAKKNNRSDMLIIGTDAIPDAIEAVEKGELAGTVFQDAKGQGGGAIDVLVNKDKAESVTYVPFQLITKDNVSEFK